MIQWIVSSSVLILVVIALRYVLRGKISLRVQYALWLLVLVRLLVPVSFGATDLSVMNAVPERAPTEQQGNYKRDIVGERNDAAPAAPTVGVPAQSMNEPVPPDLVQNITTATVTAPTVEKTDWAQIAKTVWLVGAAAVGLVFLAVNLRFGRRLRRSREQLADARARLPVYESGATDTPCLFGVAKPSIYVTPDTRTDAEALRYALAHEQTHYRHGDNLWAVLRGVCLALHWYNPLVWWAAELSRRDAELACDEATIRRLGESERAAYGRTLIRMTCEKRPALLVTATMMTDSGKGLKERISLLVKKPRTAAYTAVAVLLIACLSVACTFTGGKGNAELADPFGRDYEAAEVMYQAPEYDFGLTADTAPYFRIGADGQSLTVVDFNRNGLPAESLYGALEEYTLTKENFDDRFRAAEDGTSGWADKTGSAASLRRENAKAWHCTAAEDPSWPEEIYLLQQKDGTLYLIMGYDWEASERFPDGLHFFRWLFRLTEKSVPTYASMEAYVLSVIDGLKQPNGYTYYILPDGAESSADGTPIEVTEAAVDVRVTELVKLGDCADLTPDGTPELWLFSYEVKPEDKAGALPDRFFWVGGNNITDDGYISDGFFYYLTVLRTDDGVYRLLDSTKTNEGLWYNGVGYDDPYEYLYDFYADYAGLDVPRYMIPSFFTGLISDPTLPQTSEDAVGHRYDGDGWLLYTPVTAWARTTNAGEDCWYSGYQTGSTLRVDRSVDSVEMMESFYRDNGFTLEQYREGAALRGPWTRFDAESGTQFENYLMPIAEGGCYILSTYWTPTDEVVTNQWGDWNKGARVQNEAVELRQMAQSFTVSGSAYSYVPTFQGDLKLASNGGAARLYLTENGETVGDYSARNAWNIPALNFYNYVMCDAPKETGGQIALWLSNNDSSHFVFYEGTNVVGYFRGSDPGEYYEAQDDFSIVDKDGRRLYDQILLWYDEAEFRSMHDEVEQSAIPDRGQSWEEAAQEYLNAYEGVHLQVRSGSAYKFTWMKNLVRSADEDVAQWAQERQPQPGERLYYFYSTTEFVPETERALSMAIAGNTGECGDPDAPEGAYEYTRCCSITLEEDGWHGSVLGTGW